MPVSCDPEGSNVRARVIGDVNHPVDILPIGAMIMDKDYSVTWNDIKNRVEKWLLEKRGIGGDEPIPMGTIDYAMTMVWKEFCDEKDEE